MPSKQQVSALLRQGLDYAEIARRLDIAPGQAYLIATGFPADGAATLTRMGGLGESRGSRAQTMVNPREVSPTARGDVLDWMKRRAFGDAAMRPAASASESPAPGVG